jgi:hypothetical protein
MGSIVIGIFVGRNHNIGSQGRLSRIECVLVTAQIVCHIIETSGLVLIDVIILQHNVVEFFWLKYWLIPCKWNTANPS